MKKAYVMKTFYGIGEPELRLIRDKGGKITSDYIQARTSAAYIPSNATEALVFKISEEDAAVYEDLEYSEGQVVELARNNARILNGKFYYFGRKTSDNCSFAVCGIINASAEVIGIGNTAEEALADTWYRLGYEEGYTGSPEQLDRLNSSYATTIAYITEEAVKRVEDGDYTLHSGNLILHNACKDAFEVCTKEEYIHVLMTEYDSNFHEWQEG